MREPCEESGGTCEDWWTCPDGTASTEGGTCDSVISVCCTPIDPDNTCELGGGSCVAWGESCPLLMLPAPTVSCGDWSNMCCEWGFK